MSIGSPSQPNVKGFSPLPTYLLNAWRMQPTAIKGLTVLTGGAALVLAIRYFRSLARPVHPREIEGRKYIQVNPPFVIVHPNQVSDKPFRSLHGTSITEQILPKFDGGYVQGILHFKPKVIAGDIRDLLCMELYYKNEVLGIWTILVTDLPQDIFMPNLPKNDQITVKFSWPSCQQPREIIITVDQVRGFYCIDYRTMCTSSPLEEKVFPSSVNGRPTANILAMGGKKFDECLSYRLTTEGIQVSQEIPSNYQWRFINTTKTFQVCILKLQAKKNEEAKGIEGAASIVLRPNENIDFTKESLQKIANDVLFVDAKDLIISLKEIQQIIYYTI